MIYKGGEEARVRDRVLGDRVKGRVVKLGEGKVTVVSRGPWDPDKPDKEVRAEYDPAGLTLLGRG